MPEHSSEDFGGGIAMAYSAKMATASAVAPIITDNCLRIAETPWGGKRRLVHLHWKDQELRDIATEVPAVALGGGPRLHEQESFRQRTLHKACGLDVQRLVGRILQPAVRHLKPATRSSAQLKAGTPLRIVESPLLHFVDNNILLVGRAIIDGIVSPIESLPSIRRSFVMATPGSLSNQIEELFGIGAVIIVACRDIVE